MIFRKRNGAKAAIQSRNRYIRLHDIDPGLAVCFLALILCGLLILYAASYYNAQDKGGAMDEVVSQLMGVGAGSLLMLAVFRIDYKMLERI